MRETGDVDLLGRDAVMAEPAGGELIVASGRDRIRFLHGVLSGDIEQAAPGTGLHAVLLTAKGQLTSDLRLFVRRDDVWIVVAAGEADATAAALSRYAIMDDFAAARRADFVLDGIFGPAAAARLGAAGLDARQLEGRPPLCHLDVQGPDGAPVWLARVRGLGVDGYWVGGAAGVISSVREHLATTGVPRLAPAAAEAARIQAREPRWGADIVPGRFPMEVGLEGALDYAKGCYLGQEPIVRIRDRGHVNWRLCGLEIEAPEAALAPGDALENDARPSAGQITSAAVLPDGRAVALALVHATIPTGAEVRVRKGERLIRARVRP